MGTKCSILFARMEIISLTTVLRSPTVNGNHSASSRSSLKISDLQQMPSNNSEKHPMAASKEKYNAQSFMNKDINQDLTKKKNP